MIFKKLSTNYNRSSIVKLKIKKLEPEDAEDKSQAIKYFKLAIDKNDHNAMCNYANILYEGNGVPVNKEEAIKYYKISADKGVDKAMHMYAYMYACAYVEECF